jgi:hypothetical protein
MFVELVFFKAKPSIPDAEVIQSAHKIQALAGKTGTPFQLELLKSADGEWVEIVRWNNQQEAERVEQVVLSMPEAQQAMAVMDESSIRMVFLHPI